MCSPISDFRSTDLSRGCEGCFEFKHAGQVCFVVDSLENLTSEFSSIVGLGSIELVTEITMNYPDKINRTNRDYP